MNEGLDGQETRTEPHGVDTLFAAVYPELRRLAHRRLSAERAGHSLSTTGLVHEAYLKLSGQRQDAYANRAQFFALAAQAMRRILVDYARRHRALKRGRGEAGVSLSHLDDAGALDVPALEQAEARADLILALDDALDELRAIEERLAQVVEYRFFAGLTEQEAAELLGVTARTVARDWVRARGWLYQRLEGLRATE
ncbi:MAG TPA: ECF-type sigma factor [Gemmatimonadaceae bacterium]|nr:ECF-type sigma factor [Gemmatimonadaceae bacterium]